MATDLHVTSMGQGERLVFVHGSGGWGEESFAEQRELAAQFRVELVDRRGFGDSPSTSRVDWEVDARDLEALLDLPAHLVGHSYGAIACLLCPRSTPENRPLIDSSKPANGGVSGRGFTTRSLQAGASLSRFDSTHVRVWTEARSAFLGRLWGSFSAPRAAFP